MSGVHGVRYASGDGVALVGLGAWALVRAAADDPFLAVLWPLVEAGGSIVDVVEAMARHGIRDLPALAVVAPAGTRTHVLLRGDLVVSAFVPGEEPYRLDAGDIATWLECPLLADTAEVVLALSTDARDAATLPTGGGSVLASTLRIALGAVPAPPPALTTASSNGHGTTLTFVEPPAGDQPDDGEASSYAHLFEATRTPADVPEPRGLIDSIAWGTATEVPATREVDERTVTRPPAVAAPSDRIGPLVHAISCPAGHLNPPQGAACRLCRAPLPDVDPVTAPRPVLGELRLSTGGVVTLDRDVLLGRGPKDLADGDERPHVVKVNNPANDVSRNHVAVRLDGWHVLVEDLGSTNGTLVRMPGEEPQRLRPKELVPIPPGTDVVLADGISFRYEVQS